MAKLTQSSQGKGQSSISSFFTPKGSQPPPRPSPSSPPAPKEATYLYDAESDEEPVRSVLNLTKRPLTETANAGNDALEPPPKRAKSVAPAESTKPKAPRPSPRTERYIYTGSSQISAAEPVTEVEDEDAVEKARKKELHERWVNKMGSASIGRRWTEDTAAVEDEGEDGEEDEAPPPPKTKRKGAKTGKLTPMEVQFLDIKRKHMDTLLIVEVGYKFKFFGEDARTAAKELSIVCIPGKFRYDERKYLHTILPGYADEVNRSL